MVDGDGATPALAPEYPVETERLLLRPIDPVGDVDAIHAYLSREDVCAYIPIPVSTREQVGSATATRNGPGPCSPRRVRRSAWRSCSRRPAS